MYPNGSLPEALYTESPLLRMVSRGHNGTVTVTSIDRTGSTITFDPPLMFDPENYASITVSKREPRRVHGFPAPLALRANRRR